MDLSIFDFSLNLRLDYETAVAGIICEYGSLSALAKVLQRGCDPLRVSRKVARRQNEPRRVPS